MKEIKIKQKNNINLKGVYEFTKSKILTPSQWRLHDKIVFLRSKGENVIDLIRELNKICDKKIYTFENIICTTGVKMIANNLTNNAPTNTMVANYIALGTGTTAVVIGDTTLETEVYRNAVASKTNSNGIAYISGFFSATEDDDTYYEAGVFSDGSGAADSGILVSHVLLDAPTGIQKGLTSTLTIDWVLTIS